MNFTNVIHGADEHSFDALIYPDQHPANRNYIENQLTKFSDTVSDTGRVFLEQSVNLYNAVNSSAAIQSARSAIRQAKGIFHPNIVTEFHDIEEIRMAQPIMQRYVMAQPDIRNLYHKQRCNGYSDSYVDMEPDEVGRYHYDYRRVMSGIIVDDEEDGWKVNMYIHDDLGEDTRLSSNDKVDIIHTWDLITMFIEAGKDPTSIEGDDL